MNKIHTLAFNPIQTNTYLAYNVESKKAFVIDPSFSTEQEWDFFLKEVNKNALSIEKVLLTHPHFDHLMGAYRLCSYLDKPLVLHKKAESLLSFSLDPSKTYGLIVEALPSKLEFLQDEDEIFVCDQIKLRSLYTPGHCEGSVVFVWDEEKTVFTGDLIFRESVGRTDLGSGDLDLLLESIKNKVFTLAKDYTIRPGHGGRTSVEHEMLNNPFLM